MKYYVIAIQILINKSILPITDASNYGLRVWVKVMYKSLLTLCKSFLVKCGVIDELCYLVYLKIYYFICFNYIIFSDFCRFS